VSGSYQEPITLASLLSGTDVRNFGVVGNRLNADGSVNAAAVDDTAAFQAAMDACQSGQISSLRLPLYPFCPYIPGQLKIKGTTFAPNVVRSHPVVIEGSNGAMLTGTDQNSWGSLISLEYEPSVNLTTVYANDYAVAAGLIPTISGGNFSSTAGQAWVNGVLTSFLAVAPTAFPTASPWYWVDINPGGTATFVPAASSTAAMAAAWTAGAIRVVLIRIVGGVLSTFWDVRCWPGKIDARSQGQLILRNLSLVHMGSAPAGTSAPFIKATNTQVICQNVLFRGTTAATAAVVPAHDAIHWGGTQSPLTGASTETTTAYSPVGSYQMHLTGCRFSRVRRLLYARSAAANLFMADAFCFTDCGGDLTAPAAIEFDGLPGVKAYTNTITQTTIEATFYKYGILCNHYAMQNNLSITVTDQATGAILPSATGTMAAVRFEDDPSTVDGNIAQVAWDNETAGIGFVPVSSGAAAAGIGSYNTAVTGVTPPIFPGLFDSKWHLLSPSAQIGAAAGPATAPGIAAGAAAAAATFQANPPATDMRGSVNWTAQAAPVAGIVATITFASAFNKVPVVYLTPDAGSAGGAGNATAIRYSYTVTTTQLVIRAEGPTTDQAANGAYRVGYGVIG
jgi:hypothetical protein